MKIYSSSTYFTPEGSKRHHANISRLCSAYRCPKIILYMFQYILAVPQIERLHQFIYVSVLSIMLKIVITD